MAICGRCGRRISDNSTKCSHCGAYSRKRASLSSALSYAVRILLFLFVVVSILLLLSLA